MSLQQPAKINSLSRETPAARVLIKTSSPGPGQTLILKDKCPLNYKTLKCQFVTLKLRHSRQQRADKGSFTKGTQLKGEMLRMQLSFLKFPQILHVFR